MTMTPAICVLCGQPLDDHAQVVHDVSVDALDSTMRSMDGFAVRRQQREARLAARGFKPVTDEDRARGDFGTGLRIMDEDE